MPKISPVALQEVQDALERYRNEVDDTDLSPKTKKTYIRHASTFVRWLADNFTPGSQLKSR